MLGSGPRGFRDWQREGPFDGAVLLNEWNADHVFPYAGGWQSVERFAYLGGTWAVPATGPPVLATAVWSTDATVNNIIGQRQFWLDPGIPATGVLPYPMQMRLPNLGPFVQIEGLGGVAASHFQWYARLFVTNRVHPLEFIPYGAVLIDQPGVVVAANGTLDQFPASYYAGPVRMKMYSDQGGSIDLYYRFDRNNWHFIDRVTLGANVQTQGTFVVPPGAWKIVLNNASAVNAANFQLSVVPSFTGST